jgi:hypothetical protein
MTKLTRRSSRKSSSSPLQTSKMLQSLLRQHSGETIRLGELIYSLGGRAFSPTLLICALPEAMPLPIAGISAIIGAPLVIFSGQLLLGFSSPWLPQWLMNRAFKRQDFEKIVGQVLRYLKRCERVICPRWQWATHPVTERFLGFLFLVLALVIVLPIPFGNMLPAIAVIVISLGLIESDGLLVVIGTIASLVILVVMAGAIMTLFTWVRTWLAI